MKENVSSSFEENAGVQRIMSREFGRIEEIEEKLALAQKRADEALNTANNSTKVGRIFGHQRSIQENQAANKNTATAVAALSEASGYMFTFMKELANIADSISDLGATSIAANYTVLKEIRSYLAKTPDDKLSDFSRKKLLEVAKKLAEYKSRMEKEEENAQIVRIHSEKLAKMSQWTDSIDAEISEIEQHMTGIDCELEEINIQLQKMDQRFLDNEASLKHHDTDIKELRKKVNQKHKSMELADAVIDKVQQIDVKKTGSKAFGIFMIVIGGYFLSCALLGTLAMTLSGMYADMEIGEVVGVAIFLAGIAAISLVVLLKGMKKAKK